MKTQVPTGTVFRAAQVEPGPRGSDRLVKLSCASETPIRRLGYYEKLDMAGARLDRLRREGPLLVNHETNQHVGKVDACWIEGGKLRVVARLGTSPLAGLTLEDIQNEVRTGCSIGYNIYRAEESPEKIDGLPVVIVRDWEPIEVTLASIPADVSVGVNRGHAAAGRPAVHGEGVQVMDANNTDRVMTRQEEVGVILELGERHKVPELAQRAIKNGTELEQFQADVLAELAKRSGGPLRASTVEYSELNQRSELGIPDNDKQNFNLLRAINALANPTVRRAQEAAGLEFEISHEYAKRMGRAARGLYVPHEVLSVFTSGRRALLKGAPSTGGNLVATDLLSASFIDLLRNKSVVMPLATMVPGLVGDVAIPRQTGGNAAGWVTEDNPVGDRNATFDQVPMESRTIGANQYLSRKMLLQSTPAIEQLLREDIAKAIGLGIDFAAIAGPVGGAGPVGILNNPAVTNIVVGGDNGAVADWEHIVELETLVAAANADTGRMAYLTTPGIRGLLKRIERVAGSGVFVWGDDPVVEGVDGRLNGYPAYVSNQVPSTLDKGNSLDVCHAILFGDWSSVLIGLWSGVDIIVDTATAATKGGVTIVALQDVDIALRHPESFAVMKDALVG